MTVRTGMISVWSFEIPLEWLQEGQIAYLSSLPAARPAVEWIWSEMDRVWDSLGMDNSLPLSMQATGDYYSHPVWLVNGIFTATDEASRGHRTAISKRLANDLPKHVADYGGGFGELAKRLPVQSPGTRVDIVEPFPTTLSRGLMSEHSNAAFVDKLGAEYDAVVVQDVLEHVEDPIALVIELAHATKPGGTLLFANCFYPVIKCHLPCTFYLRRTFNFVLKGLGLEYLGVVVGAEHAVVFRRHAVLDTDRCWRRNSLARRVGPLLNKLVDLGKSLLRPFRR